jgi:N-acetylglucosamine malate deacetylase 1
MKPMMPKQVCAVFAHPDDEVLGCGASLARHAALGNSVHILILATGLTSRGTIGSKQIEALKSDARRAADILCAEDIQFADFPDNRMDSVALLDIVQRTETFLSENSPDIVYTHFGADLNIDHRITADAVTTALRPQPGAICPQILACEVNSSTEWTTHPATAFQPNEFLVAGEHLETKVKALECYTSELRVSPHPRSAEGVRALARWRGCQIGVDAAEAFVSVRRIVR